MFKFNDKLVLEIDGEYMPVTCARSQISPKSKSLWVSPCVGPNFWAKLENLITLEEYASIKASAAAQSIDLANPQEFADALAKLGSAEAIEELCDRLCQFLFVKGRNYTPKSRSNKLAAYSKLVKELPVTEGTTGFYQIKQDGSQWLRHLYYKYTGIADTNWADINKNASQKVVKNLADQKPLDAKRYEQCVSKLLASKQVWEIGAGLIAASGRRPIEIVIDGEFEVDGNGLKFGGQAKKRNEDFEDYYIPLIGCTLELFIEKLKQFRNSRKIKSHIARVEAGEFTEGKEADNITIQINRLGIVPAMAWIPVEKNAPTCRDLRAAWVAIVESRFKDNSKYSLLYRSEILGHKLNVGNIPALNYSRYAVDNQSTEQCLKPLTSFVELAASALDLNQLADSSSIVPATYQNQPEPFTVATGPILQSSQTSEICELNPDSSTALSEVPPVKISVVAETKPDLTAIDLAFGGKCSESSTIADPSLLDGRTLRERCLADVAKLLPASEWSDIKSKAQSCYRQRKLERHTSETASSLLPTPTTYPSGSKAGNSPAGRNNLESKLRSLLPTPRNNDGTQGFNSGKTGGINITGVLKRDRHLMPGEAANPQVWGWMMGFPENWAENVLMPDGLRALADLDGGSETSPLSGSVSPVKILPAAESVSPTTEPPASPAKQSPLLSELSTLPVDEAVTADIGGRHEFDFYETPPWLTLLALTNVPLSGTIGECCVGHKAISAILEMAGLKTWTNDIDQKKTADYHSDATLPESWQQFPAADWIVTNPPYADMSAPIVKNAYAHAGKGIVMILRQNWIEGCDDRRDFLKAHPPTLAISVPRYCYRKGKNGSWATDQCPTWIYVWDKANKSGLTKILTFGADEIPLFHRTPGGIPSVEKIEAQVQRIMANKPVEEGDRITRIMLDFMEQNALKPNRIYVGQNAVKKLCGVGSDKANAWIREHKELLAKHNEGVSPFGANQQQAIRNL